MKAKRFLRFLGVLSLSFFIIICFVSKSPQAADAFTCTGEDLNPKVKNGELNKKVGNFLVLLDASSTMADKTKSDGKNEQRKLPLAKNLEAVLDLLDQAHLDEKLGRDLRARSAGGQVHLDHLDVPEQ